MILASYRFLVRLAAPLLIGLVRLRALRGHEEQAHWGERWGRPSLPRPEGKVLWVHAASVGEMRSALPLVRVLLEKNRDLSILFTTVTVTAARMVRRAKNPRILHQYATLDHPAWVRRFLDHWRPDAVAWVESEIWPTMLGSISARKLPLMMINGRLSDRSAQRWLSIPKTIARVLSLFDIILAQSADDGERLTSLGARDVKVA